MEGDMLKQLTRAMKASTYFLEHDERERWKRICRHRGVTPHSEIRHYIASMFERYPDI
jgi:hypothetical protein